MIRHLKKYRNLEISKIEDGIYYIIGDEFPMQLIITKELNPGENLWIQSLRKNIKSKKEIEFLLKMYEGKKHSKLYQAAMNAITRANWKTMVEVKKTMCDALKELMEEEFQEYGDQITQQLVKNAYESIKDKKAISEILKMPLEEVEKILES